MLDELKNIYVNNNTIIKLDPYEMIIMELLLEKKEYNSYLPMSEIEIKIKKIKKDMINKIIGQLKEKLSKTNTEIICKRGIGYYINIKGDK